jgi:hypothetical protein
MLFGKGNRWEVALAGSGASTRLLRLLPIGSMVFAFVWTRAHVDSAFAIPWNALVIAAPLLLCVAAFEQWPALRIGGIVAAVGIAVRLVHFARFSMDEGADMLPLTRSAIARFLTGNSPYTYYNLPDPVPLTYYPLTWLAFLPAYLLHVDLRWTNLVAELAVLAAIVSAGTDRRKTSIPQSGTPSMNAGGAAVLAWSFQFLLPSSVYFDRITTAPVAWALLAWCLVLCANESRHDWLVVGLTAAATPLASILAPFVFLTWWWRRNSLRDAAVRGAKAGLVAIGILAPFVVWSPRGFVDGAILWFNDPSRYPGVTWKAYQPWQQYIGFGGLFWRTGLERMLAPIQWLLVGSLVVLFARRRPEADSLASHLSAAFVVFMAFNTVHWPYFYQPAIFSALVAVALADGATRGREQEPERGRRPEREAPARPVIDPHGHRDTFDAHEPAAP